MEFKAYAKLNLTLDVLGKRENGYHDLCMVMQSITLCDTLTMAPGAGETTRVSCSFSFLPNDEHNLAAKAALRFYEARGEKPKPLDIDIQKHIPVCAGMAGGSTDAAAVLRALNEWEGRPYTLPELAHIGEKVGSDVPYCVLGGTALAEGTGELLTPLPPLPDCYVVICKPDFSISTPELFARVDSVKLRRRPDTPGMLSALKSGNLSEVARRMYNVFEDVLPSRQAAQVADIKRVMIQHGALGANMSGTGPTAFGLFSSEAQAKAAYNTLSREYPDVFLARTAPAFQ